MGLVGVRYVAGCMAHVMAHALPCPGVFLSASADMTDIDDQTAYELVAPVMWFGYGCGGGRFACCSRWSGAMAVGC